MKKPRARERKPPRAVWFVVDAYGELVTHHPRRDDARDYLSVYASDSDGPHTVHRYVLDDQAKGRGVKRT